MNQASNVLYGQVVTTVSVVLASVWIATQSAASSLGFDQQLGRPWFELRGYPVYQPWRLFGWWFRFGNASPSTFDRAGLIASGGSATAVLLAFGMSIWRQVLRLRLRDALERVLETRESLSSIGLGAGFASQSHFGDAFRAEFGEAPGRVRRLAAPALRELRMRARTR